MEMTFELCYTIVDRDSWRSKEGLKIKSNLADDESVECDLPASLVKQLKEGAVTLEADRLLLSIAEAQKRAIETSYEELNDMALQAKVNSDAAYEALNTIALDTETKYEALEKTFSTTEKRFKKSIEATTTEIKQSVDSLFDVNDILLNLDRYSLKSLTETIKELFKLAEKDAELMKLVLNYKAANKGVKE